MSLESRLTPLFVTGLISGAFLTASACAQGNSNSLASRPAAEAPTATASAPPPAAALAVATFAGGCFWCMEPPFEKLDGVKTVVSGYTGGKEENPSYKQVSYGKTGHAEAVRVTYDPKVVSYETLLDQFWRSIDPTDGGGQFADRGRHYRTAIFVHDDAQRAAAEASKAALQKSGIFDKPVATPIESAAAFWVAEGYHQDYYKKNPDHYNRYRKGSGRGPFLARVWGTDYPKPDTKAVSQR